MINHLVKIINIYSRTDIQPKAIGNKATDIDKKVIFGVDKVKRIPSSYSFDNLL